MAVLNLFGLDRMKTRFHQYLALTALAMMFTASAFAQGPTAAAAAAQSNQAKAAALKPPPGAKVAIVEFEDFQCPDCARAHPLVMDMVNKYKIPLKRYDFPLPMHNWAFQAAIVNRYFDSKSAKLGESWRDFVFKNQSSITSQDQLMQRAEEFAKSNGTSMPFVLDPGGKFDKAVKADVALGMRVGVQHTPTIWIVSNGGKNEPFVEVVDRSVMSQMIETALRNAGSSATPAKAAPAKSATKKK